MSERNTPAFSEPPELDVYGRERVDPPPVPPEFAAEDDVNDQNYVPAPCQVACPIGTDAPSYIAYIWEGKIEEAFEAITATNPFSSVCGRVCDAPCEPACRRTESDGPIAIRNLKRFVMDRLGKDHRLPPVPVTKEQTVGIVGGGPAGLTAAQGLAEAGYAVDVYELTEMLGGYMTWGIPAFRCPPEIFKEDIDRMLARCPGITINLNTGLGRDITLEKLKERHDAVLLTIGAWWGKGLELANAGYDDRVIDGVTFLRHVNGGTRPELPQKVIVVGAGDVAMDACRVAKRLPGCEDVKVLYRRGPNEIPARRDELEGALEEGVELIYNVQPVAVVGTNGSNGSFALRCVTTELTKPGDDGRRWPASIAGSEHDYDCGMVILATGQRSECEELDSLGMLANDKVHTDWDSMRTTDPKVFSAGDAAFGPSTIVMAMQHGHRAAYYIKAFLEGVEGPLPYRVPFKTRRVPIADDPDWEIFPREHQDFRGLGEQPVEFPEIETTYDEDAARREAARCYRCDAETGAADYNVHTREDIFVMARTKPENATKQRAIFTKRLALRGDPFAEKPATLEDLVFLPANLSRLVIDPYRDACNVTTSLGSRLELGSPFMAAGFDSTPSEVREAVAHALRTQNLGYLGHRSIGDGVHWLQVIVPGEGEPSPDAAAVIATAPTGLERAHADQLLGLTARSDQLRERIPLALQAELDLMVLEGSSQVIDPWPELAGPPDLTVLRDAIALLRELNHEEDLQLVYFGGVRSGTDGAKLIGLGANTVVASMAIALAIGGTIENGGVRFYGNIEAAERDEAAELFLKALAYEASIMPRCTGKTDIHNIEPEDLRSITVATAEATGLPLAGARASR
ncbi:MAG: FAD-dependent oxidoreductase [Actinomycetia bacterium]|nr:FAD-dependent oxidoreductase [Actinomycetes bacterium]